MRMKRKGPQSNFNYTKTRLGTVRVHDSLMVSTDKVAVVELVVEVGDASFRVRGDSKRFLGDKKRPADKHDPNIAIGLAFERALQKVVKKIQRQNEGLMVHYEKQAASAKKKKKGKK